MPPEAVEVSWMVAEDENFGKVVRKGREIARPEWGHSVHVEVDGLEPDRWYWYQFKAGGEVSPKARTRTTPAAGVMPSNFRFAVASCQHFEAGLYEAYRHMLGENVDCVVHLGDYIYENGGRPNQVRKHAGAEIKTVEDYRTRYAQYKCDPHLQAVHLVAPWIVTWDDHEVDNNYAGEISEVRDLTPRQFLQRRAAAYQAYYENMPLRRSSVPVGPDMQIYRRISIGSLADFFVLDTRQYRTDQPCGDKRGPQCPEALAPNATLLGAAQREWLFDNLSKATARWNILAQQVMMARVDRTAGEAREFSMDQWPGYEMERRKVIQHLHDARVPNPVVLTGDIHTNWANELTLESDTEFRSPVAAEFVGTSITSGGDGRRNPARLADTLAENPFVKFHNAERGYMLCELSPNEWRSHYRTVEYVSKPGAPRHTRASFTLQSGSAKLLS